MPEPSKGEEGNPAQKRKKTAKAKAGNGKSAGQQDAESLLRADHRKVEQLFDQYEKAANASRKAEFARQICLELIVHARLEEEIFYPACRASISDRPLDEAQVEHDSAKALIAELLAGSPNDEFFDAKVKVLSEQIKHHVNEEEKAASGIFAQAKEAGVDMKALGETIAARKQELMQEMEAQAPPPPEPVSFHTQPRAGESRQLTKENAMPGRQSGNYRERDERGRFTEDDDSNGGGRGRQYSSSSSGRSSRYDDDEYDDDRRGQNQYFSGRYSSGRSSGGYEGEGDYGRRGQNQYSSGQSSGRYREEEGGYDRRGQNQYSSGRSSGRYEDEDDDRRGRSMSSRSSSERYRDEDEDDDRGRNGGRGRGWFGDQEGHSQAARSRGGGRSSDDDRRGGSSGRDRDEEGRFTSGRGRRRRDDDYEDNRRSASNRGSSGRQTGGWFGDPEGHSEASRRGWRQSDHEGSGWYGDPEGHSQASRRGWENRR